MSKPFVALDLAQFAAVLDRFGFTRAVREVHVHHTDGPTHADHAREGSEAILERMHDEHVHGLGWSDIGQHATVDPHGTVWTGRGWNRAPASEPGRNGDHRAGPFMVQMIGDFDAGSDTLRGAQRAAAAEVIARVQLRFGLPAAAFRFHRDLGDALSCPGSTLTRDELLAAVEEARARAAAEAARAGAASPRDRPFEPAESDDAPAFAATVASALAALATDPLSAALEAEERSSHLDHAPEHRAPAAPAPAPAPRPARGGARRALCVGINAYPARPLGGCVADAGLWAATLRGRGFTVRTLLDGEASREAILGALEGMVEESAPGDVLVFQFAGHGTHFPDGSQGGVTDEEDGEDEALVTLEADRTEGLVLDDDQFALFSRLPAGVSLTCFYDCCHSGTTSRARMALSRGAGAGVDPRPRGMVPTQAMWEAYRRLRAARGPRPRGRREEMRNVAFAACRDEEFAWEENGHGVFTLRATEMLAALETPPPCHATFQARIDEAFRTARQRPQLDCPAAARPLPLLEPLPAREDAAPERAAERHGEGDGDETLFREITVLETTRLRALHHRIAQVLERRAPA